MKLNKSLLIDNYYDMFVHREFIGMTKSGVLFRTVVEISGRLYAFDHESHPLLDCFALCPDQIDAEEVWERDEVVNTYFTKKELGERYA